MGYFRDYLEYLKEELFWKKRNADTPRWLWPIYRWLGFKTAHERRRERIADWQRSAASVCLNSLVEVERALEVAFQGKPPSGLMFKMEIEIWPGRFTKEGEKRIRAYAEKVNKKSLGGVIGRKVVDIDYDPRYCEAFRYDEKYISLNESKLDEAWHFSEARNGYSIYLTWPP